jgi:hypothetical protein
MSNGLLMSKAQFIIPALPCLAPLLMYYASELHCMRLRRQPRAGKLQSPATSHCFLISSKIRNLRILFLACSRVVCYVS